MEKLQSIALLQKKISIPNFRKCLSFVFGQKFILICPVTWNVSFVSYRPARFSRLTPKYSFSSTEMSDRSFVCVYDEFLIINYFIILFLFSGLSSSF